MRSARLWSVRHARGLDRLYRWVESSLRAARPLFPLIGPARVERWVYAVEKRIKRFLFDSQSCGQCILGASGMSCPMNCPKEIRNGPCGGVRQDGTCEIDPSMPCVWVQAWDGSQRILGGVEKLQAVQGAVDYSLQGTSAWLREARRPAAENILAVDGAQPAGGSHAL